MRVGIVGCGQIADAHLQQIKRIDNAETVAVCDLNKHLAEQSAIRFQINNFYTDVELLIKETKPDVIHITTPPTSHYALAKIILKYGIHIYMEKPFTVNLQEAKDIVELAKKKGCQICAGHSIAFDPSYLRLISAFKNGRLGELVHMNAGMGYGLKGPFGKVMMSDPNHWVHKLPGGIPHNNISHPVSLIMGIMKEKQVKVLARGYKWRKEKYGDERDKFYDELRVLLSGESSTASITFSSKIRPLELYLDVFGTKCIARLNIYARTLTFDTGATLPGPFEKVNWARNYFKEAKKEYKANLKNLVKSNIYYFDGMKNLIEQFYISINKGDEMPITMDQTLLETKIIDDIFREVNS